MLLVLIQSGWFILTPDLNGDLTAPWQSDKSPLVNLRKVSRPIFMLTPSIVYALWRDGKFLGEIMAYKTKTRYSHD